MKTIISKWFDVATLLPGRKINSYEELAPLVNLSSLCSHFNKLTHWSNLVCGKGDIRLAKHAGKSYSGLWGWILKCLFWKKYIILEPVFPAGTQNNVEFVAGFYSKQFGLCKVSDQLRFLSDGPFAMRMGPDDCEFFIVSELEFGPCQLRGCGYVNKDIDLL